MLTFWNGDFSFLIRTLTSSFQTQLTLNWWFTLFLIEKREAISFHHFKASRRGESGSTDSFYFLGPQNTVDGDGSHEITRGLLLGRKAMTNLDSALRSRDIILPINFHIVKDMVLPVVMYGCESWTIKKTEHQRIYAFELWCWRRLLRVPWTARRPNQSILKKINADYSLEGLMLKLKLQNFGYPMCLANSLEKTLMLGKTEGRRRRGRQRMRWLDGPTQWTWICANSGRQWRTEDPDVLQSMGLQQQQQSPVRVFSSCKIRSLSAS